MNILTDKLPDTLTIGGREYRICTDFRVWIRFMQSAMTGHSDMERIALIFCTVFDEFPEDIGAALNAMMDFCTMSRHEETGGRENGARVYDFDADAELIYAAFLQQYGIDLCETDMHWYKFKALFDNLCGETQFVRAVQYRSTDTSKIKDREQRQFVRKMKRLFKLPDNRTDEDRAADFDNAFAGMFM